jgi:hypothetical protein
MFKEKAGVNAGKIWNTLNGTEGLTRKEIKKVNKKMTDKDLYLGLGWLLREEKVSAETKDGDLFVTLI